MDTEIKSLIDRLVDLGAEEQELRFWGDIMRDLDESDQEKLIKMLEHETRQLEAVAKA